MKKKFGNLNFDSIEALSRKEQSKIVGGYGTVASNHGTVCAYTCTTVLGSSRDVASSSGSPCKWYESTAYGPCASY